MDSVGSPLLRRTRVATWVAVAALGLLARLRPGLARAATATLVATLGVAHGATDDAILDRLGIRLPGGRAMLSILYGVSAVGTFALARRMPEAASRALTALSCLHFGAGDAAFARACGSRGGIALETLVRGTLPLGIAGADARSRTLFTLALAYALRHAYCGRRDDALDVALPAILLLVLPPRVGFGVYFGAWHALRHTALVLDRDPRGGSTRTRATRFARESAPNVAIALGVGALAFAWERTRDEGAAPDADESARTEAIAGALILAITVPHEIAVGIIERHSRTA